MTEEIPLYQEEPELLSSFLTESSEFNQILNECLLEGEEALKSGSTLSKEKINEMFRAAHTIKGTSSFIGLTRTSNLTHEMETLLDRVREEKMDLTLEIIDILFLAFDTLESLFQSLGDNGSEDIDVSQALAKIQAALAGEQIIQTPPVETITETANAVQETSEGIAQGMEKYLPQYLDESEQILEEVDSFMLKLEENVDDKQLIDGLFRHFHTLKGSAGLMQRNDVQKVAHLLEDILSLVREKKLHPNEDMYRLCFSGVDHIKSIITRMKKGDLSQENVDEIVTKLDQYKNGNEQHHINQKAETKSQDSFIQNDYHSLTNQYKSEINEAFNSDKDVFHLHFVVSKNAGVKSAKIEILERRLTSIGNIITIQPSSVEIDNDLNSHLDVHVILASIQNEKEIKQTLLVDEVKLESIERVESSTVKKGNDKSTRDEPAIAVNMAVETTSKAQSMSNNNTQLMKDDIKEKKSAQTMESTTIRMDTRKLDKLMNLAGELVITKARLVQIHNVLSQELQYIKNDTQGVASLQKEYGTLKNKLRDFVLQSVRTGEQGDLMKQFEAVDMQVNNLGSRLHQNNLITFMREFDEMNNILSKISSDIQSGIMQARMVPVEGVFNRFKRVVRDLSKDLHKDVKLEIRGEDTEIDKNIIDELANPLTHMVRNAVDHGVETQADRGKTNKDPMATVTLAASHRGNNICIQISDDGRGLDESKLVQKALEKEIITIEQAETMSSQEKLQLIFAPGFSTAEKVTGVSGRGVGMDVVKNMIESIKGSVDIQTTLGSGTTFTLNIPLTLAIIQALLVKINNRPYAFPLNSVTEIIKVVPEEIYSIDGTNTVKLREHALSLIDLRNTLHIDKGNHLNAAGKDVISTMKVVVVNDGEDQVGVIVDSLIGEEEIVIKALSDHFASVKGIAGASVLGDGQIALILEANSIIREAR